LHYWQLSLPLPKAEVKVGTVVATPVAAVRATTTAEAAKAEALATGMAAAAARAEEAVTAAKETVGMEAGAVLVDMLEAAARATEVIAAEVVEALEVAVWGMGERVVATRLGTTTAEPAAAVLTQREPGAVEAQAGRVATAAAENPGERRDHRPRLQHRVRPVQQIRVLRQALQVPSRH